MQWTPRGAHLLLQTRTKVLNNDLENVFRGWYPEFTLGPPDPRLLDALHKRSYGAHCSIHQGFDSLA